MKNEMFPRILFVYILIAGVFSFPFLYVYHITSQWNPFALNGKKFLVFYGIGIAIGGSVVLLLRNYIRFFTLLRGWVIVLLAIGLARLCQGLYYHKPVGYLLLLMMSLLILQRVVQVLHNKKR